MKDHLHLKRGDEVELEITGSAFEGKSVARLQGLVVFVDGAVQGDTVIARIVKTKKNLVEAKLVRLLKSSPLRVKPNCPHFGVCGGCKWQHVDYPGQLQFKQQQVIDAFERIGGFANPPIAPIIGAEEIFFYRNKMEFSFADQEWLEFPPARDSASFTKEGPTDSSQSTIRNQKSSIFLGLHVPQRYDKILDLRECHLQSEVSNRILASTRSCCRRIGVPVYSSEHDSGFLRFLVIRQSRRRNEIMVNLVTRTDDPSFMTKFANTLKSEIPEVTTIVNTINTKRAQIAYGELERVYTGEGIIREQLGSHTFIVSPGSFFQTNTVQAEKLYETAKALGEFKKSDVVFDLYSGTGSIAFFVSSAVERVVGIESAESAVKDAERNAAANGIANCDFILGDIKDRLTKDTAWMSKYAHPDVVILDPPRSGVHPKVVEKVVEIAPARIVYVSCNPATQARDIKQLCTGRYRLERIQPVDMFPHTYHIENVASLILQ
jgi:23S rRNA (uracil1939-C5)-methyltransferase